MADINTAEKEIEKLLSEFIENPNDSKIKDKAISLEKKYAGLTTINDHYKNKPIPENLMKAIPFLQEIYQYEKSTDENNTITKAKKILKTLKKQ